MAHDQPVLRSSAGAPPGQTLTRKWPITGEKAPPPEALDAAGWRLAFGGLIAAPDLTLAAYHALPHRDLVADIHCVTGWSHQAMCFTGIPLAELLAHLAIEVPAAARFVRFEAYSARGHDTSLPLAAALADTWLVHARDGEPLEPGHGGPLRTVTPGRYFYKSLKWVRRIELLATDQLGYWERESHYHNNADWHSGQERYTSGAIRPERVAAFRKAGDYARLRGPAHLLLGVDLAGWRPATPAVGAVHIKNSNLRGAQLAGADLRGANLTACDLQGADLHAADLRGADLEGVNFVGADLRDADLRETALSAAVFTTERGAARVDGLRWSGATGLLEAQEAFLRAQPTVP